MSKFLLHCENKELKNNYYKKKKLSETAWTYSDSPYAKYGYN